jgi:S-DNA-T family DNA segregation ATPase FtsK/SpoIIIE
MIDPKRVEFASYAGIPHLEQPVITDMDHATAALDGLVHDMVDRLSVLSDTNSKDIYGYNKKTGNLMPYVVLVVDELADLMAYGGSKIEASLVRLAQLGRAAGIHLILATQRPSTDVVTGLIKANLPVRIAFKTSSNTDSRVVLGQSGAEKLMGNGDLLFSIGQSSIARRVQGAWVEEEETQLLVEHWKEQSRWNCFVKG